MGVSSQALIGWKLGIEDIREDALNDIRSKLTASNVARELFTSFAAKLVSKKLLHSFLLTLGLLQPYSGHGFRDPVPLQNLHREECQTVDGAHPENGVWGNTLPSYNLGFGLRQVARKSFRTVNRHRLYFRKANRNQGGSKRRRACSRHKNIKFYLQHWPIHSRSPAFYPAKQTWARTCSAGRRVVGMF
jgi:hypothetical protein